MSEHTIALIVAIDRNRLIGRDGGLPWRLPNDLKHFKRLTVGKTVLMGRKTWESLGRPLPDRQNWVLTRDASFTAQGCRVFRDLDAALRAHGTGELMVIGGADLYRQTLPLARRLYLTEVDASLEGDAHFPDYDPAQWREIASEAHPADERHAFAYRFRTLERRA
ncbi:dihydrofolate reductase [Fontimonas sp. SYSU GA230001]|uniref:dihydrofolate reductase n=1 Tax=Fontimonas sp. SYSU GA230001 TaxID=3142450 RepID=UPI0032B57A2C